MSLLDSSTVAAVSLALDASTLRQRVAAQNIANVHTPGYQPLSVDFERRVSAMLNAERSGQPVAAAALRAATPGLQVNAGLTVQLDTELAALSETTLHQQALLKMLNRHLGLLNTAINEGKR